MRLSPSARVAATLATIVLAMWGRGVAAQGVYSEPWHTIETDHFLVHYHASIADLAPDVAAMCEAAHEALTPIVAAPPTRRTHVVLTDDVDSANGSATVLPRNLMRLFAVPPDSKSTLGHYENWLWNLVLHEYTHVLHIDTMGGLFRALNAPLGKRFAPNQQLPRWFIEGLAVHYESRDTDRGRATSSLFRAYARMASLEDAVPPLGALNGTPTEWPQATAWYLYGGFFVDYIASTRGEDALRDFIERYGRRVIPYGINVTADATLGAPMTELWAEWRAALDGQSLAEALAVRARGQTPVEPVTERGHRSREVEVDGARVGWIVDDGHRPAELVVHADGEASTWRLDAGGEFAFVPSEPFVILSQPTLHDRASTYRDLYQLDLRTGDVSRLTWGARAREPAVSTDGASIAWVAPRSGRFELHVMDRTTGASRKVFEAGPWWQVSRPSFVPGADVVVVSILRPGHGRDLAEVDLVTGELRWLTSDAAFDDEPSVTADGRHVLFATDRGGVFDIWALSRETGATRRVTRSVGGTYGPTLQHSPDGPRLWFATYASDGFDIGRWSMSDDWWDQATDDGVGAAPEGRTPPEFVVDDLAAPRRYRSALRAGPTRWTPSFAVDGDDSLLGVSLIGGDPVGVHSWVATVDWTFADDTPVYGVDLTTRALPVSLGLSSSRRVIPRAERFVAESRFVPYTEVEWSASGSVSVPFGPLRSRHGVTLRHGVQINDYLGGEPQVEHRPEDIEPRGPEYLRLDATTLSYSWSNIEGATHAIAPVRGTSIGTSLRVRTSALGSDVESAAWTWSARTFAPIDRGATWIAALRGAGGFGEASGVGRRLFGVGGPAPQDVLVALWEDTPAGTLHVRGYEPNTRVGDRYLLLNAEVRMRFANLNAGIDTLPLFFRRLSLAVFVDAGDAYDDQPSFDDALLGLGGEVRWDATLGYFQGAAFRFGAARGLGRDGVTDLYLLYGWAF